MKQVLFVIPMMIISVAIPGAILLLLIFVGAPVDRYLCNSYAEATGRTTKYILLDGCYVETGSGWVTRNELQEIICK